MENLIDIIIPVLVVIFYLFSIAKGKKNQEKQDETQGADPFQGQRTRDIQAEIKRKIQERQAEIGGYSYDPTKPDSVQGPSMKQSDEEYEEYADAEPDLSEVMETIFSTEEKEPEEEEYYQEDPESQFANIETELQQQLARVRETKVQADRAKHAHYKQLANEWGEHKETKHIQLPTQKAILQDSVAARQAFIYLEIFGTPKGLRNNDAIKPSWN